MCAHMYIYIYQARQHALSSTRKHPRVRSQRSNERGHSMSKTGAQHQQDTRQGDSRHAAGRASKTRFRELDTQHVQIIQPHEREHTMCHRVVAETPASEHTCNPRPVRAVKNPARGADTRTREARTSFALPRVSRRVLLQAGAAGRSTRCASSRIRYHKPVDVAVRRRCLVGCSLAGKCLRAEALAVRGPGCQKGCI